MAKIVSWRNAPPKVFDVAAPGRSKTGCVGVKTEHLAESEEQRIHYLLRRLKRPAYLRLTLSAALRNLRSRAELRFGVITMICLLVETSTPERRGFRVLMLPPFSSPRGSSPPRSGSGRTRSSRRRFPG